MGTTGKITAEAQEAISSKSAFVRLENFSGPLDLLLHLVRRGEMDIFKIDIHKITRSYVAYLERIPQPDLESAGDFIRMAGALLYIKSKSLLPDEKTEDDPSPSAEELKARLSHSLQLYQKFKRVGDLLSRRPLLGRDCWKSPRRLAGPDPKEAKMIIDKEKGLVFLMQARHRRIRQTQAKGNYQVKEPIPSFLSRLRQTAKLFKAGARLSFSRFLTVKKQRHSRLLSFLSLLELSKAGFIKILQTRLFSRIEIFVKRSLTASALQELSPESEKESP